MSLTGNKRDNIKKYILESIFYKKHKNVVQKAAETHGVSQQTIYRYIRELVDDGSITKEARGKYSVVQTVNKTYKYDLTEKHLEEDIIFNETLRQYISGFERNTFDIWQYAFTEMVNNVIDHSEATELRIYIGQNALCTWVNIYDNGIGIFEKIKNFYNYSSIDDAIVSLFKGKLTTDNENHSGEGIFFTSRVMDHFGALSSNKMFSQNNTLESLRDLEHSSPKMQRYKDKPGTLIIMGLVNESNRLLKEVFDMYASVDGGFTITNIPMKRICDSGYPVSRSQAKRLYFGFDKFKKVILDFTDVDEIGQAFAHELFNVFAKRHPEVTLECVNTNEDIDRMITRAKSE